MRRILVTAVSGDIGNGIVEILLKANETVFACDINSHVACMCDVEGFYQSLMAVNEGYIPQLLSKCKEFNITHLIPTNEREIEIINANRLLFEKAGIKLVIQSAHVVENCLDKYLTMKLLSDNGICVPKYGLSIDELSLSEDEKFICKGRKSNGSKDICIFDNINEFNRAGIEVGEDYILQNYIEGDEYTLGIFGHKGIVKSIAFKRVLANGHTCKVELVQSKELETIADRIAAVCELEGYINAQMRLCDGRYYIFEINPRISGTVGFRDKLGFSDVLWWLDILDGVNTFEAYHPKYTEAVGIRYLAEKYVVLK